MKKLYLELIEIGRVTLNVDSIIPCGRALD